MKARGKLLEPLIGGRDVFDWSWIEENIPNGEVMAIFRNPVSRAISHFHNAQTLAFSARKMTEKVLMTLTTVLTPIYEFFITSKFVHKSVESPQIGYVKDFII